LARETLRLERCLAMFFNFLAICHFNANAIAIANARF
jgi:hypothetical protein